FFHLSERISSVADTVFFFRGKLCCGQPSVWEKENWVIPESIFPFLFIPDSSLYSPSYNIFSAVRENCCYGAYKPCRSFFIWNSLHTVYKILVFNPVRSILSHVSCRIDPWLFIQVIYFQT